MKINKIRKLGLGNKLLILFVVILVPALVWVFGEIGKHGIKKTWNNNLKMILILWLLELVVFWVGIILV